VAAKQSDVTMDNPDSAKLLEFLHRQRDHLYERQTLKTAARQQGDRVLQIKDRPRPRSDSSSDDATAAPAAPTAHVLAFYGQPQLSKVDSKNTCKYVQVCS
jgi:hypothetical protein